MSTWRVGIYVENSNYYKLQAIITVKEQTWIRKVHTILHKNNDKEK